jgi:hypothetical protein
MANDQYTYGVPGLIKYAFLGLARDARDKGLTDQALEAEKMAAFASLRRHQDTMGPGTLAAENFMYRINGSFRDAAERAKQSYSPAQRLVYLNEAIRITRNVLGQ